MVGLGKNIIFSGFVLILIGVVVLVLGKMSPIGRLPGDVFFKKGNFTFYFPITTCIILSLIFSLIMFFISRK